MALESSLKQLIRSQCVYFPIGHIQPRGLEWHGTSFFAKSTYSNLTNSSTIELAFI